MSSLAPRPYDSSPVPASSAKPLRTWIWSLAGICFLFGGSMAVQLRAVERSRDNRAFEQKGVKAAEKRLSAMREKAKEDARKTKELQMQFAALQKRMESGYVPLSTVKQLNEQLEDLRLVAGLTAVVGHGVTIKLADNPQAAQAGGGSFMPGIVHDFDLQQTVHELLSAKAEAIAIKGAGGGWIRVTGYTPIRCVGPTICVDFKSCAAPFTIAAIGNPATLKSALETPRGIIDSLRQQKIGVRIAAKRNLKLPAMEGIPSFRDAKAVEESTKIALAH